MFPYQLICFSICVGIVVCVYLLNSQYSYVLFTCFMVSLFFQMVIMVCVYFKIKKSSEFKEELIKENVWAYKSKVAMIF